MCSGRPPGPGTRSGWSGGSTGGDAPAVVAPPADATVAAGGTVTFGGALQGSQLVAVQWQVSSDDGRTFSNVLGAVKPTLTLKHVKAVQTGFLYRSVLTNAFDQVVTSSARLTVS